ncbi:MAG: deoxyribodipyrimidine photo-lyase [Phycisphaerae bacterium]
MKHRALMWFRADLRITDNTALAHAAAYARDGIVATFCICPKQWQAHDWGAVKVDFLLRNLAELADSLATRNIPLRLIDTDRFDAVPAKLLKLAQDTACDALFFNDEYEVNEAARDDEVVAAFEADNRKVHRYVDQTILNVARIRTSEDKFYSVFTPFKKTWISRYEDSQSERHSTPDKQTDINLKSDDVPKKVTGYSSKDTHRELWPAGEKAAKTRLTRFINEQIRDYKKQRDFPARDGTSAISPYLALGVLSPRECLRVALDENNGKLDGGNDGIATWISELIWREFYRHVLIGWPRVSKHRAFRPETEKLDWSGNEDEFAAWKDGKTGIPIVDAGMRQLAETGWMHNRVRMIVAMFLTKNLFQDWRKGEAWFMQQLVDGDLASNNGGWQWSASTGTDAAPYFRIFNPITQGARFDPDAEYIKQHVPELRELSAKQIHAEPEKRDWPDDLDYPQPIVDLKESRSRAIEAFKKL